MTHKEQEIKGLLVSFYRDSTKGDYLEALNKYTKEISELPNKTKQEINALWVRFYIDCTNHNPLNNDTTEFVKTPQKVFEWIENYCLK